jgi:uncharacterized protein YbjT (DUF2867 family)
MNISISDEGQAEPHQHLSTAQGTQSMILITGAGGTVGTALVEELKGSDQQIRLAFRSKDKAKKAAAAGNNVVTLDYAQPETLGPAFEDVDTMFLLGTGVLGQAEGEINLVNAAKAAGVKRIVKLSVWGADAEEYALARMHRTVERAIEASGLDWTFLRPNNFMQSLIAYEAETIRAERAFYLPAGQAKVNHIDVRDIARVAAKALMAPGHAGKAYNLSGPKAISYAEVADILSEVLGKQVRYVAVPDDAAKSAMIAGGAPELYADYLIELNQYFRAGGAAGVSSAVKDVTGRDPIMFEQFARDYAAAFA